MKTRILPALSALLIAFTIFAASGGALYASAQTDDTSPPQYGLIITSDAVFFRTASDSFSADNVYFYLPETYFVKIIAPAGELMYEAEYNGLTGFVRRSDLSVKDYEPISKYPQGLRLRISGDVSLNVRAQPTTSSSVITALSLGGQDITYYNYIDGEEYSAGNTSWYFITVNINDIAIYGYVYSGNITLTGQITYPNDTSPVPEPPPATDPETATPPYDAITQGIIIAAICIPTILVIYLIFKPSRAKSTTTYQAQDSPYINDH